MADQNGKEMIYLDRNENNYDPAPQCCDVLKNIDFRRLSWYTRIHEKNAKGELSLRLAKEYNLPEKYIAMGYGGEDLLKLYAVIMVILQTLTDLKTKLVEKDAI
jgi:histidinol-phosphate aminotransferase